MTISGANQSVTIAGSISANGSSITNINASSITSGTLAVAQGGTGATTLTANNVLLGNGTSAFQTVAPGTAGNVLTSNGTTWTSVAAAAFDSGTAMLFAQTAAPTGWTKSTTHNDKALRVVSGTASSGGTTAFTTVFTNQTPTINTSGLSAGATTLNTTQIPSHTHSYSYGSSAVNASNDPQVYPIFTAAGNTGATGGGGSHSHTISGSATSSAVTLNVAYVDVIIATKN
jgi:hypothetical protein